MITISHRGGGSLGTPKSDYVICARPLVLKFGFFVVDRGCSILYRAQIGKIEMFSSLNGKRAVPWLSE